VERESRKNGPGLSKKEKEEEKELQLLRHILRRGGDAKGGSYTAGGANEGGRGDREVQEIGKQGPILPTINHTTGKGQRGSIIVGWYKVLPYQAPKEFRRNMCGGAYVVNALNLQNLQRH